MLIPYSMSQYRSWFAPEFPKRLDVYTFNGRNGFSVTGPDNSRLLESNALGESVAGIGDINGDGKSDFLVGDRIMNTAHVIFGANNFPNNIDVLTLNGTNGFSITNGGYVIAAAGDVNGDGIDDFLIGGDHAVYVIFGAHTFPKAIDVGRLNITTGFKIILDEAKASVWSVASIGDVNGDGKSDIIVGIDGDGAYVVFGTSCFPASINASLLNGRNGFKITGPAPTEFGAVVASAGDINGDGKLDIIVGGEGSRAYVIFGSNTCSISIDISELDGTNGFMIKGDSYSRMRTVVSSAGDTNGDGISDLIIGSSGDSTVYVVFGTSSFPPVINTDIKMLDGVDLLKIKGDDWFGGSVAGIGDINDDGKSDIIIGTERSGAHVIFGASSFPDTLEVSELSGRNGFSLTGPMYFYFGESVAGIGDINGDGKPDFMVGAGGLGAYVILDASYAAQPAPPPILYDVVEDNSEDEITVRVLDTEAILNNNPFDLQLSNCSWIGYIGTKCLIYNTNEILSVGTEMSEYISAYLEERGNLVVRSYSNIVLKDDIWWNSNNKLTFISQQNITLASSASINPGGTLELKSGIENLEGKGTVVFEGDHTQIDAGETGKVIIHYNPDQGEEEHKYHNPSSYYRHVIPLSAIEKYMLVNNIQDLQDMYYMLHMRYSLSQDISGPLPNNLKFRPITLFQSDESPITFSGDLDGNGYTIKDVEISFPKSNDVGLFSRCTGSPFSPVKISNVVFENFKVEGKTRAAVICAHAQYVEITNVVVKNCEVYGDDVVGGVVGATVLSKFHNITIENLTLSSTSTKGTIAGAAMENQFICSANVDYTQSALVGKDIETNTFEEC